MPTTHIIHHNDPDGWCSAAIVFFSVNVVYDESNLIRFHEMNYGMKLPWDAINKKDKVIMLDFSLPMDEMKKLQELVGFSSFIWIDHHVSAINDAVNRNFQSHGIREVGLAACELSWNYFNPNCITPVNVTMIGRYDVWDRGEWPNALYAMYAVKSLPGFNSPASMAWRDILDAKIDLIKIGEPIARYQEGVNIEICKRAAFVTELRGQDKIYKAIACNSPLCNSMLFDSAWDSMLYDIMLSFYIGSNGFYNVSIYSTRPEIDCSVIAKSFGGGGHKGAAGFQCTNLPFFPKECYNA